MCLTPKGAMLQFVHLFKLIWTFHSGYALDWNSCFNISNGIRTTMSLQKCQEQCLLSDTCTYISYCRQTGVCHVVSLTFETDSFVNNNCTGWVVVYRKNILQDVLHSVDVTPFIECDVHVPDFNGCRIKGNMYHSGHSIKVQCDLLHYYCQDSTFVCDTNGIWTFEKCLTSILPKEATCVSDIDVFSTGIFENVALNKTVTMSSQLSHVSPGCLMVDGMRNPNYPCAHTHIGDIDPYIVVDLEEIYTIHSIYILNRRDCCAERLHDFALSFGTTLTTLMTRLKHTGTVGTDCTIMLDPPVQARYFNIYMNGQEILTICAFEVYTKLVEA